MIYHDVGLTGRRRRRRLLVSFRLDSWQRVTDSTENAVGVFVQCLVVPDEIIADVTRPADGVLQSPVNVDVFVLLNFAECEANEILEIRPACETC